MTLAFSHKSKEDQEDGLSGWTAASFEIVDTWTQEGGFCHLEAQKRGYELD